MKNHPKEIDIKDFSYNLPEEKIAKYPLEKREESKLLLYKDGIISESVFKNIINELPENALIVFNNTRVIHARLIFNRKTGAQIEVFCIEPLDHLDYQLAFLSKKNCMWKCMLGNAKRWKEETLSKQIDTSLGKVNLTVHKQGKIGELEVVKFSWDNDQLCFAEVLHFAGILPLPPYLNRDTEISDEERYQTIYAKVQGSVAAPTAGLHFTTEVLDTLQTKKISQTEITLHVGAGTFKPVKTTSLAEHEMHEETLFIELASLKSIYQCLSENRKLIAVGTTSARSLESLYWHGLKLIRGTASENIEVGQWDPYELNEIDTSPTRAIQAIIADLQNRKQTAVTGSTQIIIAPGYSFKIVDLLITNFHQPENTLILLIAAFVGNDWKHIYDYALQHKFRFLSYGDSSLLWRSRINN